MLVSAGEDSGDLYASELLAQLRLRRPDLDAFGLGGDRVQGRGVQLIAHTQDLAVVGLQEVVSHLRKLRAIFRHVLDEVDRHRPQLAVLVDYPDFNLRLGKELSKRGIPIVYYVSPQIWAWRKGRMRTIRSIV